MADFKHAFGARVKFIRKSRNLTQEKLSEMIDIHLRQMSKIETGEHFPSYKTLENLCFSLNIQPQELFDFKIDSETTPQTSISPKLNVLWNKILKLSENESYTKFLTLAIESLKDKKALEELSLIIEGMKLIQNKH